MFPDFWKYCYIMFAMTLVREIPHPASDQFDLARLLASVGDPIRLALVRLLSDGRERTCSEIQEALGLPSSTCSYHLRLLREAGMTLTRAEGTERRTTVRRDDLEQRFPGLLEILEG
jgi:DNA-binding transcriptional ArsR family regulator